MGTEEVARVRLRQLLLDVALDRHQVEDRGREVGDRAPLPMRDVTGHGQGLKVDLRSHDRTSEAQQDTALERLDPAGEDQEVAVARGAQRGPVAARVLVEDVVSDAHVDGGRHREAVGGGEHAQVPMGEAALRHPPADVLPQAEPPLPGLADPVVELARLPPEAELAALHVAGDALRGGSDPGQLVVVDGPRAVHGDEVDQPALHEVDEVAAHPGPEQVGAHHQDPGRPAAAGVQEAPRHLREAGVREGRRLFVETEPVLDAQVVHAIGEGLHAQERPVEHLVLRSHDGNSAPESSSRPRKLGTM